jgi:hypothetical protein
MKPFATPYSEQHAGCSGNQLWTDTEIPIYLRSTRKDFAICYASEPMNSIASPVAMLFSSRPISLYSDEESLPCCWGLRVFKHPSTSWTSRRHPGDGCTQWPQISTGSSAPRASSRPFVVHLEPLVQFTHLASFASSAPGWMTSDPFAVFAIDFCAQLSLHRLSLPRQLLNGPSY